MAKVVSKYLRSRIPQRVKARDTHIVEIYVGEKFQIYAIDFSGIFMISRWRSVACIPLAPPRLNRAWVREILFRPVLVPVRASPVPSVVRGSCCKIL